MNDIQPMQKQDFKKFFIEKGDPGFNPERNKAIINDSIRRYELMRKKKLHEFDDAYGERADAVTTYIKAIDRGRVSTRLDHFFTPNQIRVFRGDELRAKLHEGIKFIKTMRSLQKK